MNESVKNALSIVTRSHLRFVSLVNCNVQCERVYSENMNGNFDDSAQLDPVAAELSKLYYFCLGKHRLYVLARNMEARKELGGFLIKIPYHLFHFVEIMPDKDDSEIFVIHLKEKPIEYPWCPREIYFRSPARDWVIGQIKICWKTDYMFQTLKVGVFDIKKTHEDLLDRLVYTNPSVYRIKVMPPSWQPGGGVSNTGPSEFSAAPPHPSMYLYQVKDYEFFAHKDFNPASKRNEKGIFYRNKGKKKDHTKGELFWVRPSPPVDMSDIREDECINVQALATSVLKNDIATLVRDYRVIETPTACLKHGNPGGDIASWEAWMVRVRTLGVRPNVKEPYLADCVANRDITIIACRRKYIPPTMDMSQDIVIVYCGLLHGYGSTSAYVTPQGILDTMMPRSKGFESDDIVVQTRADALLLTEEEYSWFLSRLRIKPVGWKRGLQFCKSLALMLERAGLSGLLTHPRAKILFNDVVLRDDQDDPFEFASYFEKEVEGLGDMVEPVVLEEWRRRVWKFLAWCIDRGMLPCVFSINSLVYFYNVLTGQPRPQSKLGQVFESILYLHAPGEPYVNSPLIAKVRDERLMRKFTFNEYVMIRLLESGYLKTILNQQADTSEYPRFLVRLLQRKQGNAGGKYAANLRYAIAKQLVQLSMQFSASTLEVIKKNKVAVVRNTGTVPLADDISINIIVPTLFRMVTTNDENLQILAVVALVNYTLKNVIMKNVVMSGGIVRRVVSFLASKSSDLVRHSCALLNNCTKSEQYRQTVASFSAIPLMVNLIQPSNIPPTYPTVPILINALAVLGNLATDVSLRQKILDSCGYTTDAVGSMKETKKGQRIPTVITIFGQLLDEDADIRESTADGVGNDDAIEDKGAEYGNDNDGNNINNNNSDEPLATLYFHVFNLLKNLSVKIKAGDTSNKRCMRYVLADAFRIFKATQSIPLKSVILEYFYVLSFDQSVLHDMYSNHSLRLMLDKMAETSVEGLEGIVKDLRRLHEALLNN